VINLRSQNVALLIKHLDKFYNRRDIPWVTLIWNTYYSNGKVPHASKKKRFPFGGETFLSWETCSEALQPIQLGMAHQSCFGQTCGMSTIFNKNSPDFILMQKTSTFQWHNSSSATIVRSSSIYLYRWKHFKNIRSYNKYSKYS
jgi:hypothetical protein